MYGVLLDSIFEVMRDQFDAEQWTQIQRLAGYDCNREVNEFQSYSDTLISRLTSAAHLVTGISPDQVRGSVYRLCVGDSSKASTGVAY